MRDFIGDNIIIDGRMIGYRVHTAYEYLKLKGLDEEEIEDFQENKYDIYELITQIIAVKQSCWLLRRTRYSCGSLSDGMLDLKYKLINELKENYDYDFDDDLMEKYCCF